MVSARVEEVSNGYLVINYATHQDEIATFYENKSAALAAAQAFLQKGLDD